MWDTNTILTWPMFSINLLLIQNTLRKYSWKTFLMNHHLRWMCQYLFLNGPIPASLSLYWSCLQQTIDRGSFENFANARISSVVSNCSAHCTSTTTTCLCDKTYVLFTAILACISVEGETSSALFMPRRTCFFWS